MSRLIMFAAAILLIIPGITSNLIGLAIFIGMTAYSFLGKQKKIVKQTAKISMIFLEVYS